MAKRDGSSKTELFNVRLNVQDFSQLPRAYAWASPSALSPRWPLGILSSPYGGRHAGPVRPRPVTYHTATTSAVVATFRPKPPAATKTIPICPCTFSHSSCGSAFRRCVGAWRGISKWQAARLAFWSSPKRPKSGRCTFSHSSCAPICWGSVWGPAMILAKRSQNKPKCGPLETSAATRVATSAATSAEAVH